MSGMTLEVLSYHCTACLAGCLVDTVELSSYPYHIVSTALSGWLLVDTVELISYHIIYNVVTMALLFACLVNTEELIS